MDTKYLEYIITIAEEKNMTKAAEKLFVSQSSLSYYLSKLEQELNTPLFIRGKNEFILTPAGEMYLSAARDVIGIKKKLYQNIANIQNQGNLSIASTSQWGIQVISKVIPQFRDAFPGITFQLESQMDLSLILWQIDNEKLDFALAAVPSVDWLGKERNYVFLGEEELVAALPATHPYCKKNPGHIMDEADLVELFAGETVILSKKGSANRALMDNITEKHRMRPLSICEVNGMKTTISLVSQNTGIGIIPVSALNPEAPMGIYSLNPPVFRHDILLTRKHLVINPPEQTLTRYIQSCMPSRWVYSPKQDKPD